MKLSGKKKTNQCVTDIQRNKLDSINENPKKATRAVN